MKAKATHTFKKEPNEFYVEPRWCSERLFAEYVKAHDDSSLQWPVLDPFCGTGRVLDAAAKFGLKTRGQDLVERGNVSKRHPFVQRNFFKRTTWREGVQLVSNPPFKPWHRIVSHAHYIGCKQVTLLLPYNALFGMRNIDFCKEFWPQEIFRLSPRPPMPPGKMILKGYEPKGGRVDFVWIRWEFGAGLPPALLWSDLRR